MISTKWFGCVSLLVLMTGCSAGGEPEAEEGAAGAETTGTVRQAEVLETTYDQCGSVLSVQNDTYAYTTIPRGDWTRVDLINNRFRWKCGGTLEWATCPEGTDWVNVKHSTLSRRITWQCQD